MIKAYILDDEQHAHVVLRTLIERHFESEIKIVGSAQSAEVAIKELPILQPDLLFLDIEMPNINGMEMISQVDKENCSVIFVTAYDNFAVDAFNERARGYLLKPVDKEKFVKTVRDVIQKISLEKKAKKISKDSLESISDVAIPHNGTFELVNPFTVLYLQADGSYTKIISENESFLVSKNLKSASEDFDHDFFIKVNRSFIVNGKHVKSYTKKNGGSICLSNKIEISISATYRDSVFKSLNSMLEN